MISFAKLDELLALKREHDRLLQASVDLASAETCRDWPASRATIAINDCGRIEVGADLQDAAAFMRMTLEKRLTDCERRIGDLGVADITRDLPEPSFDPDDDDIPF